MSPDAVLSAWIRQTLRHEPRDIALFRRALTHGSHDGPTYQRLEFLGDRVLGLSIAAWLYEQFPDDPEGKLSARLNAVVSRETCAEIGRALGAPEHLILGKQAREDGAQLSDNVVGDVVEALIGALYLEAGLDGAAAFIRHAWDGKLDRRGEAPKHPKSALQEWAAARQCAPPGFTGDAPGGQSRWATERSTAWQPLRPELVVEVRYDQVTGCRFRHGTTFLRWRPDKAPGQCRMDQLARELKPAELEELLGV
jgi:ribonuclease-3